MARRKTTAKKEPDFGGVAKFRGGYVKQTHVGAAHTVTLKRTGKKPTTFRGTKAEADAVFIQTIAKEKK